VIQFGIDPKCAEAPKNGSLDVMFSELGPGKYRFRVGTLEVKYSSGDTGSNVFRVGTLELDNGAPGIIYPIIQHGVL
jgi:hypothetical protein